MSFEDFIVYFKTIYVGYFQKNYVYQSLSVISKAKNSLYFTFDIPSDGEYYFTAI
jgi:calpain-15